MTYNFEEIENPMVNIMEEDGKKLLSYKGVSNYERGGYKGKLETTINKIDLSHIKIDVTDDVSGREATISFKIIYDEIGDLFSMRQI